MKFAHPAEVMHEIRESEQAFQEEPYCRDVTPRMENHMDKKMQMQWTLRGGGDT